MKVPKLRHGATSIRSIHTVGVKSVPKTQRSQYLELYVLGSEKSRLVKEMLALDARRQTINLQLTSMNERIRKLQREIEQQQQAENGPRIPSQPIKMVDINY
jgi:hypothetical protein